MSDIVDAALAYAEQGWPVFPCNGKRPRLPNGFKGATRDPGLIRGWWSQWPDASIGIPTGTVSGVVVLDVDPRNGGTESLNNLLADRKEPLPRTRTAKTGGGGWHLYFRLNGDPVSTAVVAPGVDRKGEGGYVIAPTSSGYEWVRNEPVADLPEWLTRLSAERTNSTSTVANVIAEGERDTTLASLAGTMRRRGMSQDEIVAALQVTNEKRCRPPLERSEVERIADSIARYGPAAKILDGSGAKSGQLLKRQLTATRLSDIEMRSIEWLDKPVWQRSAFHLLVGRKGVGKGTYLAMLMAKMTRGELYERPMNALVVSSEDSASIDTRPRVSAAGGNDERIHIVNEHLQLPDDIEALRELALEVGDVGMLVIDPIGNHTMRAKTGDDGEIRYAIAQLNGLADELRCLLAGVRHLGKNAEVDALARVLGSVAWVDTPRSVIGMARDDEDEMSFHLQVLAGNRGPSGQRTGREWRMELVSLKGLSEPITKAVELGESSKDVEDLLASKKRDSSKSAKARELILDTLDGTASMESDTLDTLIAQQTGLSARTVRNLRKQLGNEGLIRSIPQKDDQNIVRGWHVARTAAPRA